VQVEVTLFGQYAQLLPPDRNGRATLEAEEGATVADILDQLGVPGEARSYVSIGGAKARLSQGLWEGAKVRVIVPLGGG